jgi:hypothetical protein
MKAFYKAISTTCAVVLLVSAIVVLMLVLVDEHGVDHALRVTVRVDSARHPDQTCHPWVQEVVQSRLGCCNNRLWLGNKRRFTALQLIILSL